MKISNFFKKIKNRWKSESPVVFKRITNFCLFISGMALAIHIAIVAAGAFEPHWWSIIYPYLIGVPAGMAFIAKITKDDGNKNEETT